MGYTMMNNNINGLLNLVLLQYQTIEIEKYSSITDTTDINYKCEHTHICI